MRDQFSRWSKSSGIAIAFLLLVIASALVEPSSLGRAALAAFWPFVGVLMVVGVGQQLIIQQRGIDLSAPGFISLSAIIVSHMPNGNNSLLIPSIFLAFGVAIVAGFVNGFMVTRVGIMPIVQTLGMNAVLYGINVAICHGTPTQTTTHLFNFMNDHVFGLQMPFVLGVIVIVAVELVMKKTIVGRRFEASGASERAGLAAGLRTNRYRYMAYVGSAMLYTLAGVMLAGIIQQPDVFQGDTYLLLSELPFSSNSKGLCSPLVRLRRFKTLFKQSRLPLGSAFTDCVRRAGCPSSSSAQGRREVTIHRWFRTPLVRVPQHDRIEAHQIV